MRMTTWATTMMCAAMLSLITAAPTLGQDQDQKSNDSKQSNKNQTTKTRPDDKNIPQPPQQEGAESSSQANNDPVGYFFAGKLLLMNQGTIQLSKVAQEQSKSDEVKQFAQQVIDSHQKLSQKVRDKCDINSEALMVAFDQSQSNNQSGQDDNSNAKNDSNENKATQDRPQVASTTTVYKPAMPAERVVSKLLNVEKQATKNYVNTSTSMMKRYQGQDFDMAYLGFQIGMHTWALAEIEAMQSEGGQSDEAKQLVKETRSMIEDHLKKARELSKKLETQQKSQG